MTTPNLAFISLFVPDLAQSVAHYRHFLACEPVTEHPAPAKHPFAASAPVVFALGTTYLALYQADQRVSHPGDVGLGLQLPHGADIATAAQRAVDCGGRCFYGPKVLADDPRELAVAVLPDRHFFEILGPTELRDTPASEG